MNSILSPVTSIQLRWVKSKIKGRHELTANGPILGSLQRVGFWKPVTQAEFNGRSWSFQRSGYARTEILEEPGSRPVAQFKANWLGGGTLIFNDGQRFQLFAKGFCKPVWSWLNDQGHKLLEAIPHDKSVRLNRDGTNRRMELKPGQAAGAHHVLLAPDTASQRRCSGRGGSLSGDCWITILSSRVDRNHLVLAAAGLYLRFELLQKSRAVLQQKIGCAHFPFLQLFIGIKCSHQLVSVLHNF